MPAFRLTFRGIGFADACDPTGRQVIDGFRAILELAEASKEEAIAAAREELLANSRIQHLIAETHEIMQVEGTWKIECEDAKRLGIWWLRPKQKEPKIVYHWTPPYDGPLPDVPSGMGHSTCTSDHCAEQAGASDGDKPSV